MPRTHAQPPRAPAAPLSAVLVDALGTRHRPAGTRARIVSLVPSITELLFTLGLGPRVVGCTRFCVHPEQALRGVARVGGTKGPDIEHIRALAPTHLIVNIDENVREEVEQMAAFVPHVVVTHPLAPADNLALYTLTGALFGAEQRARDLCDAFEGALAAVGEAAAALPARRVLYLIWRRPWMSVSADTYIARMLALVGWHNLELPGGARYPEVALTPALSSELDLVLFSSEPYPFKARHLDEARAALGMAAGARRPALLPIDGEMLSWYGSRAVAGLGYLRELAQRTAGA